MGQHNSTLVLYKNSKILKEKNLILDDIYNYLDNLDKLTIDNFQYFKNKLRTTIKVNLPQTYSTQFQPIAKGFNYLSISSYVERDGVQVRYENKDAFYFIVGYTQRSESCVEFEIELDILNTYQYNIDYKVSNKTRIMREHKDRFTQNAALNNQGIYKRIIDLQSENLQIESIRTNKTIVNDSSNTKYYLMYKNADNIAVGDNPVQCVLLSDDGGVNTRYNQIISTNKLYAIFKDKFNLEHSLVFDPVKYTPHEYIFFVYQKGNPTPYFIISNETKSYLFYEESVNSWIFRWNNEGFYDGVNDVEYVVVNSRIQNVDIYTKHTSAGVYVKNWYINGGDIKTKLLRDIDLTDSKILKIIALPYKPFTVNASENFVIDPLNYVESETFTIDAVKRNIVLNRDTNIESLIKPTLEILKNIDADFSDDLPKADDFKTIYAESKLYHSDYYQQKLVYDSFSYSFNLEEFNPSQTVEPSIFQIVQTSSKAISSKLMFDFPTWNTERSGKNDYDVLIAERNNEITIYNSAYVDYIKNGYNYDLKNKKRSDINAVIGIGTQALGAIATTMVNPIAGGLQGANLVGNIINSINQSQANADNIERKLQQTKMQASSVAGCDDFDLFERYNGNKLIYYRYEPSSVTKELLWNLFFYTGYTSNRYGLPITDSRIRFNFIQCDLVLNERGAFDEEIYNELRNKFLNGVTFLHYFEGEYDFEQKYENWETWINLQ